MPVPLIDFSRQYAYLKDDIHQAILKVFSHGGFILGPEMKQLEGEIASLCGAKHARGGGGW